MSGQFCVKSKQVLNIDACLVKLTLRMLTLLPDTNVYQKLDGSGDEVLGNFFFSISKISGALFNLSGKFDDEYLSKRRLEE